MGIFDGEIETAKELIAEYGQNVTWRSVSDAAAPDPSMPWKPGAAENTDHAVTIVFLPEGRQNSELFSFLNGTEVPTGRLIGLMAAQSFTPCIKDIVIRDGKELSVSAVDTLAPNGTHILHELRFDV